MNLSLTAWNILLKNLPKQIKALTAEFRHPAGSRYRSQSNSDGCDDAESVTQWALIRNIFLERANRGHLLDLMQIRRTTKNRHTDRCRLCLFIKHNSPVQKALFERSIVPAAQVNKHNSGNQQRDTFQKGKFDGVKVHNEKNDWMNFLAVGAMLVSAPYSISFRARSPTAWDLNRFIPPCKNLLTMQGFLGCFFNTHTGGQTDENKNNNLQANEALTH